MSEIISREKILHMWGVAEYMYQNASKYGLKPDKMYVLGLLHDIGYIKGKQDHEWYGCELMQGLGFKYSEEIRLHGESIEDIFNSFHSMTPELRLLLEADLSIGLNGEYLGYEARLKDIGNRYGFDSDTYKTCSNTIEWLKSQDK